MAAMVGLSAYATDWTGSAVGEGTYYLYNVGAGQFLSYGGSWGTQAVVDGAGIPVKLKANGSTYQIETDVTGTSGKVYLGADFYIDQNACDFTFTEVAGKTNVYTLSYVSGTTTKYRNWVTGAKTFDQVSAVGSGSNYTLESCYWMLIPESERNTKLANKEATESAPLNLTYKINNPNTAYFTGCYSSENPWTFGVENGGWAAGGRDNGSSWRDKNFEVYNKNFDNYIELTNMPKGIYKFYVTGFYRSSNNVKNVKIYANTETTDMQLIQDGASETKLCSVFGDWQDDATITVNEATAYIPNSQGGACYYFQTGKYATQSLQVELASEGTLKIGVKKETTVENDWCLVDRFKLEYLGDPDNPAPFKAERDNLIASLSSLNGTIPTACINAINSVVADNDDDYSTIAEYQTAIANINNAVSTYASAAIVNAYSAYNTIKTAALALDDDATIFTGDATVNATTADTEVEAATTVAGINDAIGTLRAAASSFLGSVTVNDGKSFDITNVFITNPAPWASTDGWNCPVAATPNSSARAAEFWNKSGVSITQEMASLPAGYYTLKAQAFARTGCSPIYIFAGAADTDSSDDNIQELIKKSNSEISTMDGAGTWFDGGNGWNTFTYQNETAGSFTIGLKDEFVPNGSHGDNNDGWLIWREFGLLYLGTEPVSVLADLYADAKAAAEAARDNATYANVAGAERAALLAAIADTPEATAESYKAKTSALIVATNSFIDDGVVLAWNNYAASFSNEVTKAIALGLTSEQANSYAATSSTTASGATACIQNLMVAEYNYVATNYSYAVDLGTWNASDNAGTMTSQHWDGTSTSSYLEQGGGNLAYNLNSWTVTYDQTLSLPAGNYIFKVAGRTASDHVTINLNVTDVTDSANPALLGTVNDFPKGDVGLGINKAGATSFDAEDAAGFANNGKGRGWQWRYVKFTLANPASVKVEVLAEADAQYRWMGFCNATVQTDDADNVALMQALVALNDAKAAATLTKRANVGTGVFQYEATNDGNLWSAYSTAKSNAEAFTLAANTEVEDVTALTTALTTAQANYSSNAVINAPDASKRYNVSIVDDGQAWDGNAITFIAGGREGEGNYNVQYAAVANVNLCQALKFTAVEGKTNTYYISAINTSGTEQYLTSKTLAYGDGTVNDQIRTTDNLVKAVEISVKATDGGFKLYNQTGTEISRNKTNPDNGLYPNGDVGSYFSITEAEKPSITINTTAAGWGTTMLPFAVSEIPEGVKVYTCAGAEGATLTLEEVTALEANKPYIIEGKWNETLTGDAQGTALNYTEGLLTGVYAQTPAPVGSYVLQKNDGKVGFYVVVEGKQPKVGANRAYVTRRAESEGVKAFYLGENDLPTAIQGVFDGLVDGDAYDLAGRKVQKLQKGGVYIINGKKVVVK